MIQRAPERLRCVVVEYGSSRLTTAGEFDQTIALSQIPSEAPLEFAQRIIERIGSVERSGRHFEAAMVLSGERQDRVAKVARRMVALALSAHARATGRPFELTLITADASSAAFGELIGLAEELMMLPRGGALLLRVRTASSLDNRHAGLAPALRQRAPGASAAQRWSRASARTQSHRCSLLNGDRT